MLRTGYGASWIAMGEACSRGTDGPRAANTTSDPGVQDVSAAHRHSPGIPPFTFSSISQVDYTRLARLADISYIDGVVVCSLFSIATSQKIVAVVSRHINAHVTPQLVVGPV